MKTVCVFVDTSTVNRILDINVERNGDLQYEKDRLYLSKIVEKYVKTGDVLVIVNPTVRQEIENTTDDQRKKRLVNLFCEFHFTSYNKTIFPFHFPATFVTEQEKETLIALVQDIPSFKKDEKVFADVAFNSQVEVLLTTDREHLANDRFRDSIRRRGLDKKIRVFTPEQLFRYLQEID